MNLDRVLYDELETQLATQLNEEELKEILRRRLSFRIPENLVFAATPRSDNIKRVITWALREGRLRDFIEVVLDSTTSPEFQLVAESVLRALDAAGDDRIAASSDARLPEHVRSRSYEDFVVVVNGRDSRATGMSMGKTPSFKVTIDPLTIDTADVLKRLHEDQQLRLEDIQVFGTHLFRILFGSAPCGHEQTRMLRTLARRCGNAKDSRDTYMRFFLRFTDQGKPLAKYPWELLFIPAGAIVLEDDSTWPDEGMFLAQEPHVTFVRSPKPAAQGTPREKPLKVLVVDGRSEDALTDTDLTKWTKHKDLQRITWQDLQRPTSATLRERCDGVDVVHFIGDGLAEGHEDKLRLSPSESLNFEKVSDILRGVRLFILHAATNAKPGSYPVFCRIATSLLSELVNELHAVMAIRLEDVRAEDFTVELYRGLLAGEFVEVAIQSARSKLGQARGEFGSPILLLRNWGALVTEAAPTQDAGGKARRAHDEYLQGARHGA